MLEGPYSRELMSEIYGYDIIGLPYCEYMNTEDDLIVFRCGKHGEFAYQVIGPQSLLVELWVKLQKIGVKYLLKTGGLDYQRIVRVENLAGIKAFTQNIQQTLSNYNCSGLSSMTRKISSAKLLLS